MAKLATPFFLDYLKSLYPRKGRDDLNPWYIISAVAFCSSNLPDEVPIVFLHALKDLQAEGGSTEDQLLLSRKMREALFKAGLTAGYPRSINSLIALHRETPNDLKDTKVMRCTDISLSEFEKIGQSLFCNIYGQTSDEVQNLLDSSYPDMGWFSKTIGYGITYGYMDILTPLETSYTLVASLIAGDNPTQIQWHLDGARRAGATLEETRAVRKISMEVASAAGVKWKNGVPNIKI